MKRFGFTIIVVVILLGAASCVSADPTKVTPFISLKQEYSDNILFSEKNKKKDFITTVSGGLAVKQTTEVMNASLNARLDQLLYMDFNELDSLDQFFSGNVNYRATQRLGLGASARYSKDSRKDREADTTGLIVSGDRETARFFLSSDYLFSETTKGDIRLGYGMVETEEINRIEDNDDVRVDLSLSRNLSKTFRNTTGLLNLSYLRYTADVETTVPGAVLTSTTFQEYTTDIVRFSTGLSKDMTELYNVYCQVGANYARTTENLRTRQTLTGTGAVVGDATFPDQEDDIWGGVISAGLKYDGLYYDMGLSVSQDMRGASGTNGAVQRSSVAGNVYGRLTDKFTLTLDASCYLNQNERNNQADTEDLTFNIQPGFRYQFYRDFIVSCFYRFTSVENRQNNTIKERNLIYIVIKKEFEF